MLARTFRRVLSSLALVCLSRHLPGQTLDPSRPLPAAQLATRHFGNDAPWFLRNIPFLEIDDPAIEQTYYYRWKLYRSHLHEIGPGRTDETEFLPSVPWARHPFEDLNGSSAFHIMEGRWLRDPAYITSLVDHLYERRLRAPAPAVHRRAPASGRRARSPGGLQPRHRRGHRGA